MGRTQQFPQLSTSSTMSRKGRDSYQVWYTKGFVEGLRRSEQGAEASSKQSQDLARVLYKLEEEKMLRRESQSLLEDATSMLQGLLSYVVGLG